MIKNKISDDFFRKAILKGNEDLLNNFSPAVREFQIGCDNLFEITRETEHKQINDRITKFVLEKTPINSSACGFVQGKSYYDFLRPHISGYYFLRLDIKKFFHSIPSYEVKALLSQFFNNEKNGNKYSALDIAYMSVIHKVSDTHIDKDFRSKEILPMGFSSSPVISNIIFRKVDILIQKLCEDKGIVYSRYADDMLFSCDNSNYLHCDQFERDISIFISTLSLRLKKRKRRATENTISLNGYVVQNKKREKGFLHVYKEKPVGSIRLSDKKLKPLKKLASLLQKQKSPVVIMESLFSLERRKFINRYGNNWNFYCKYADEQLQNKLKGYRSYLVSLIKYNDKYGCVNVECMEKLRALVGVFELNIK
ncbi:retron-type RNA-directed DNA polymerase [Vibrio maritimus]|uniref:RNA-directed DNA polymerase n=1 Tax=Vibrio maritimus TaxID=990268 RepID=A0A090T4E6_9VIBR|nr:retron-type RNA-directed DNA polymerase [Vibrio maritimus]